MSSKTPPTLGKRYSPNSLPEAGENCIKSKPPIELPLKEYPETHNPPARKRSRKTNPAVTENPSYRPPANLSVCGFSNTENSQIVDSLFQQGVPIPKASPLRKRNRARQPKVECATRADKVQFGNPVFVPNYLTPVEYFYAKLPNANLQVNNNFAGHIVFPINFFSTFKPTPVVRDFSSVEIPPHIVRPNRRIQTNVYGAGDANRAFDSEGRLYALKNCTIILLHPILKLQDTREFIAALPIPRSKEELDSQYLRRIVIARDIGVQSHVNIKVEESSPSTADTDKTAFHVVDANFRHVGRLQEVIDRVNTYEYIGNETNPTQNKESCLPQLNQTLNKLASPSPISSSPLCDRSSLGVNTANYLVLCDNCGVSSQNLKKCDSCKREIKKPKYILDSHTQRFSQNDCLKKSEDVGIPSPNRSGVKTPRNAGATRVGRKRKALGTDCITLSSDEECDVPSSKVDSKPGQVPTSKLTTASPASGGHVKTSVNSAAPNLNVPSFFSSSPISSPLLVVSQLPSPMPVTISADESFTKSKEGSSTPEHLIAELEGAEQKTELTGSLISFECRSIRVGTYKVAASDSPSEWNRVLFSSKGILFYLPHCVTNHTVKLVIPFETIMDVKFCNKKISMMFITTGPKHALWMRKQLGMGPTPDDEHFFCPLNGSPVQKNIIILLENGIKELGRGILMRIFGKTMSDLDYESAHKMLVAANTAPKHQGSPVAMPVSSRNAQYLQSTQPSVVSHTPSIIHPSIVKTEVASPLNQKPVAHINNTAISQNSVQSIAPAKPALSHQLSAIPTNETVVTNPAPPSDMPKTNIKLIKSTWGMELLDHDLESLGDEMFLNDQIIDFWLKYVETYKLSAADKKRTYVFSSFFYSKLTSKQRSEDMKIHLTTRRHNRVAKWTKNEDIFQYDFLIVPIVENAHWFLAVICFPALDGIYDFDTGEFITELKNRRTKGKSKSQENSSQESVPSLDLAQKQNRATKKLSKDDVRNIKQPCILIFDSLAQEPRNKIYSTLRDYLQVEYKVKKGVDKEFNACTMPGSMPRVPQQPNYCDCGLYTLQFAESFFTHPIKSYKHPMDDSIANWFKNQVTRAKRKEIYDAIVNLITKENPASVPHIPQLTFPSLFKAKKDTYENVVKVTHDVNQDRFLDVGTENESIKTSKVEDSPLSSPLSASPHVVKLDHDYSKANTVQNSHEKSPKVIVEQAHSSPATKVPSQTASSSNLRKEVSSTTNSTSTPKRLVKKTVTDPPTSKPVVIASKINLTVPTVSLSVNKHVSVSTPVVSVQNNSLPPRKVPCYANANSAVRKNISAEKKHLNDKSKQ